MNPRSRSHQTLDVRQEGRRVFLTLCRPEVHNAQNEALINDLHDATNGLRDRDDFDAVAIGSLGDHWCTGLDMKAAQQHGWRPSRESAERWDTAIANLQAIDQVVVGLIDGYCLGGGIQLAMACDLRVATERAVFAIPASREVGILGGMATWYLPHLLGIGRAKALMLGGAVLDAAHAAHWGLVDQVVHPDHLRAAWEQIVAPLTADTLASVGACKHIINTANDTSFQDAWTYYLNTQQRLMASPASANLAAATIELLQQGKRPYLEVGWLPFDNPNPAPPRQ
ncbi:enoyl-CoA hydratase/isomerase family protein [Pseudonocardia acaciae]|uniref:enoyl-CoA hydratase/isomerase family protein n=1 Tax=Pseudonocardia acaciae TaxID=551276 RepID=UPI00068649F1|nr:enoyl-CoA hydratase/isomerase family protein [Pseudonocardia acaciae]